MQAFDKSRCRQMAPTPNRRCVAGFSVMLDKTLRLNDKLLSLLGGMGAEYLFIWVEEGGKTMYLEKADGASEMAYPLAKNGKLRRRRRLKPCGSSRSRSPRGSWFCKAERIS